MSKSITTKSFGKTKKIKLNFEDTGVLIWADSEGNPIPGLPKKAFVVETDSKEARASFYQYKAAISSLQVAKLEAQHKESIAATSSYAEAAEMILSGAEEKLKLAKEEEKLLAKLAKLQEKQKAL